MIQQMLFAFLLLPTVFYFALVARSLHRALLTALPTEKSLEDFWGSASTAGERAHIQLARQDSLNALWKLINHNGEELDQADDFPLELVTVDVQYEDPLLRVEGWQEIERLALALRRSTLYALLQIYSVLHNQEKAVVEATLEIQPRFLPPFNLPVRLHVFFEDRVKVYKVKSEWRSVPLLTERTSPLLGKAHSWLRLGTGQLVASVVDAGYL